MSGLLPVPLPNASLEDAYRARGMVSWGHEPVLSTRDWVPVRDLVATQDMVSVSTVAALREVHNPGPIHVARIGDRLLIVDGHHRATVAVEKKHSMIYAHICSTPSIGEGVR